MSVEPIRSVGAVVARRTWFDSLGVLKLQRPAALSHDLANFETSRPRVGGEQIEAAEFLIGHRQISSRLGVVRQVAGGGCNEVLHCRGVATDRRVGRND